ncbi:hypothetical protein Tco_0788332, partial [Tanacetum coccineum]
GWVRLPSMCVIIGADGYAYPGVSNQSFMNVNHKVYDLVSCARNGIVASRVFATDGVANNIPTPVTLSLPARPWENA